MTLKSNSEKLSSAYFFIQSILAKLDFNKGVDFLDEYLEVSKNLTTEQKNSLLLNFTVEEYASLTEVQEKYKLKSDGKTTSDIEPRLFEIFKEDDDGKKYVHIIFKSVLPEIIACIEYGNDNNIKRNNQNKLNQILSRNFDFDCSDNENKNEISTVLNVNIKKIQSTRKKSPSKKSGQAIEHMQHRLNQLKKTTQSTPKSYTKTRSAATQSTPECNIQTSTAATQSTPECNIQTSTAATQSTPKNNTKTSTAATQSTPECNIQTSTAATQSTPECNIQTSTAATQSTPEFNIQTSTAATQSSPISTYQNTQNRSKSKFHPLFYISLALALCSSIGALSIIAYVKNFFKFFIFDHIHRIFLALVIGSCLFTAFTIIFALRAKNIAKNDCSASNNTSSSSIDRTHNLSLS